MNDVRNHSIDNQREFPVMLQHTPKSSPKLSSTKSVQSSSTVWMHVSVISI